MTAEFDHPWNDQTRALIIDPFHSNAIDWAKLQTQPRVAAVIHKSTSATNAIDPAYFSRRKEARDRGYLWGSYHWELPATPKRRRTTTSTPLLPQRTN